MTARDGVVAGVGLAVDGPGRHAQEVSRAGLDDDLAAGSGLEPHPPRHDVERRVVVAVVVPPGDRAGLGVDGARPHRLGVQGDLPAHPRRRVGGAEVVAGDVGARLGGGLGEVGCRCAVMPPSNPHGSSLVVSGPRLAR